MMGYKRKKQAEFDDYTDVSFKEKFGVHKVVAKQLLEDIKFTEQHWLMWTLDFLRNYNSFNYSSAHFGVCDKNFREKVWMVIDSIKQLSIKHRTLSKTKFDKDKESLPDHAADHPEATIALAVDSTFCDLETKDNGFYNGEKKRFGVKYEVACVVRTGEIVWVSGPHGASEADVDIYRQGLKQELMAIDKVRAVADKGYQGEPDTLITPFKKKQGAIHLPPMEKIYNDWVQSIRFIIENIFSSYKLFNALNRQFRGTVDQHRDIFDVITYIINLDTKFKINH
ncbi:hypothetical protein SAMD00019534_056550, partial [Acytostelium subglobosum LB1]|uniref:hypothetical protein n=1 Tax=Acytostelium subglobosum LB1 TaxID=1410327 RepID=UPI000644F979